MKINNYTLSDMRQIVRDVEAVCANYIGQHVEKVRKSGGDRLGNELVMSVSSLLAARAISIIHVWTGENMDSIKKRFMESVDAQIKPSMEKLMQHMAEKKEDV